MMHIADNQDALLDYLYEEGDPADRVRIATHLQECARCSVALLEFQTVRGMLSEWKPPASALGFRIVQDGRGVAASEGNGVVGLPPQHAWWTPSVRVGHWAQAGAAVLVFAAGMAVSQLDVRYETGALTVRARSAAPAPAVRASSIHLPATADAPQVASGSVSVAGGPATASPDAVVSTEQLLQRVRTMIEQSEIRQQRELALRLSQVASEVDTQHKADLLRIQQNFGQLEMETGAQISQQQQLMDYLVRTSGGQK